MAHILLIGVSTAAPPNGVINTFPYAFPIIISRLRKTHHTWEHLDTHLDRLSHQDLVERVLQSEARVFGISAWSHNYLEVKDLAARIRTRHPEAVIIVGGVLSGNDTVLLERTETDIVSWAAEGERVLPEILDSLDTGWEGMENVAGISFRDRRTGTIISTGKRQVMTKSEFDVEDFPAYDAFDRPLREMFAVLNARTDLPVKGFPLLTMRGCPFPCTFCGHLYGRNFLRKKWDRFFDEVQILIDRYGLEGIYSTDTNTFFSEKDVDDFCATYKARGATFTIGVELRLTFGSVEMFKKLFDHGVRLALFGYESGSQKMLDTMKKNFTVAKMKEVIEASLDADQVQHGNFLFGTPGENWQTLKETRTMMIWMEQVFARQHQRLQAKGIMGRSGYGWTVLVPSPTSELYRICLKEGLIADEEAYLESLCDESKKGLLPGSNFKIALAQRANDVNMSEFTSSQALYAAVQYILASTKVAAPLPVMARMKAARSAAGWLVRYGVITLADRLAGRRGFFPRPQSQPATISGCG